MERGSGADRPGGSDDRNARIESVRTHSRREAEKEPVRTVPPRGRALGERERIRLFLCYANADADLVARFRECFEKHVRADADFEFVLWQDWRDILLGKDWHPQILEALEEADYGLLMLSPSFFASEYIRNVELPALERRGLLPVALDIWGDHLDTCGLTEKQIFFFGKKRWFRAHDSLGRDRFVLAFVDRIRKRIAADREKREAAEKAREEEPGEPDREEGLRRWAKRRAELEAEYVEPPGRPVALESPLFREEREAPAEEKGEDVLADLLAWAEDPDGPRFYALLGDLGMGKTTTCRMLTQELLKRGGRLPVYLDLRDLPVGEMRARGEGLTLDNILRQLIERGWTASEFGRLEPKDLLDLAAEGALVIFDGLDEVLVHLDEAGGVDFVRQLFRVFEHRREEHRGRLLVSCRTHYFRTVREQGAFLRGQGREGVRGADWRGMLLLPFDRERIRLWLGRNLPERDPDALLALLESVHDLAGLARQPYALSLIAGHIGELERLRAAGRRIRAVDLYDVLVEDWLQRHFGKHQLTPEHKREVMEELALVLWREDSRGWPWARLREWLLGLLERRADWRREYALGASYLPREMVARFGEDLRTATFVVRDEEDRFRFAHSSLLEFFLARRLLRALLAGESQRFDLPEPSRETVDFLVELVAREVEREPGAKEGVRSGFEALRAGYRARASENAFRLALRLDVEVPAFADARLLTRWHLEGGDLRGLVVEGRPERPRDLSACRFDGARLREAVFTHVRFDGASFDGADLWRAEFVGCSGDGTRFAGADLTGALFRNVDATATWRGVDFEAAGRVHRAAWLGTGFADCRFPAPEFAR